jgi:uncharacterized membrane protein
MKNKLLLAYSVVALLGLLDSIYLTYTRLLGITPPCGVSIFSGCAVVARSSYSVLLGIPLSVYGIVFYGFALLLSIVLMYKEVLYGKELLLVSATAGLVSSAYFVYVQVYIIKALCIYCVFSALCALILFILSVITYKKPKK